MIIQAGDWGIATEAQRNVSILPSWKTFEREEFWDHRERRGPDRVNKNILCVYANLEFRYLENLKEQANNQNEI